MSSPAILTHRKCIQFNEEKLFSPIFLLKSERIFVTHRSLYLLARADHWYADGTFNTAPLLFEQLCNTHGLKENVLLPLESIIEIFSKNSKI